MGHTPICLPHSTQHLSDALSSYFIKVLNFVNNSSGILLRLDATFQSFLRTTEFQWLQDILARPDLHSLLPRSNLGDHLPRYSWPAEGPWWLCSDLGASLPFQILIPSKLCAPRETQIYRKPVTHPFPPPNAIHDKCFSEFLQSWGLGAGRDDLFIQPLLNNYYVLSTRCDYPILQMGKVRASKPPFWGHRASQWWWSPLAPGRLAPQSFPYHCTSLALNRTQQVTQESESVKC